MNTAILNVRTEPTIKKQAQKVADTLGFSLSSLVNGFLRELIKTKTVRFSESYEPTPYLKRAIAQARKEHKEGKFVSFSNGKDAIDYLDSVIKSK